MSSDWYSTEHISNPDGEMEVAYCDSCDYLIAADEAEEEDNCPRCNHPDNE